MATYKFEQFNVEIVDPTVWADEDTIQLQVSKNTISVNIVLTTDNAKFGVLLEDISVQNLNYEGYVNLITRVLNKLRDFEVVE
jgi:DNA mismatch repair ATPase MutS